MAQVKKEYLNSNYFEEAIEKTKELIKSIPVAMWIGIINTVLSYLYLYLPENFIINRDIGSINIQIALILFSIVGITGIYLTLTKIDKTMTKLISLLFNLAGALPWFMFIYILIVLAIS